MNCKLAENWGELTFWEKSALPLHCIIFIYVQIIIF